jgi:membrane protein YqaA with SNARE-associated domain
MKLFEPTYQYILNLASHKHAPAYLGTLSFAESSFFPIPPDVMLMPMSMAKPNKWVYFALLTTIASVLGGIAGYLLGAFSAEWVESMITNWGYTEKYEHIKALFNEWGIWIIFAAGFSPIPYKLFTISAGILSMAFVPFVLVSLMGRGARFFLVSGLIAWAGPKMEATLLKYIEWLGWLFVGLLVVVITIIKTGS